MLDVGEEGKAQKFEAHRRGTYVIDRCPSGHTSATPRSCGCQLCPWCRWHRLQRWADTLTEVPNFEGSLVLLRGRLADDYGEAKKLLRRHVLAAGGRAVFDMKPNGAAWELTVVIGGLDEGSLMKLTRNLRCGKEFTQLDSQVVDSNDLGVVLDREMTKISDFRDSPQMLGQYLETDFGQRVMRPRARKQEDDDAGFDNLLRSLGLGVEPDQDVEPTPAELMPEANFVETVPDDFLDGIPAGWGGATCDPNMAVRAGLSCRICGRNTVRLGIYQLEKTTLLRIDGNGPLTVPASEVFDPTGELRAGMHS